MARVFFRRADVTVPAAVDNPLPTEGAREGGFKANIGRRAWLAHKLEHKPGGPFLFPRVPSLSGLLHFPLTGGPVQSNLRPLVALDGLSLSGWAGCAWCGLCISAACAVTGAWRRPTPNARPRFGAGHDGCARPEPVFAHRGRSRRHRARRTLLGQVAGHAPELGYSRPTAGTEGG